MSGRQRITEQGSAWFPAALPALLRARKRAEETARRTRTALVVAKHGKPVAVRPPDRARQKRS
jgi:hypothetical protein